MAKQYTETSQFTLPAEGGYDCVTIESVRKKLIKELYTAYEWGFSTVDPDSKENVTFKILLFSSGMGELLTALGAKEIGKNKYEWDDEAVVGEKLSFVLSHKADKSGTLRVVLSDIKKVTASGNPGGVTKPSDVQWEE